MRISDWSSDVCSSDLVAADEVGAAEIDAPQVQHAEVAAQQHGPAPVDAPGKEAGMGRQHRVELGAGDPVADEELLGRPVSGEGIGPIGHYLCPFYLLLGPVKKRGSKLFAPQIF